MPVVRALRPAVDENLVGALEDWLALAKRGEITGAVLLANMPGEHLMHRWVGNISIAVALAAFEHWKRRAFDAAEAENRT